MYSYYPRLLFIFILTIFPAISMAQENISLSPDMEVLEDATGKLTLEQVQSPQYAARFTRNTSNAPNFGRTRSVYWLRFDIRRQGEQDWYLLVDNPIDKIDAWPQEQLEKLPYRSPLYRLKLPPNQSSTVYLRVNNGQAMLYLPVKLMTGKALLQHTIIQYSFFIFIFAGLTVLLIYNLFLYLNLRDPSYLSVLGIILAVGFMNYQESEIFAHYGIRSAFDGVFYNMPLLLGVSAAFHFWNQISRGSSAFINKFSRSVIWTCLLLIPFSGWWTHSRALIVIFVLSLIPAASVLTTRQKLQKHRLVGKAYLMITTVILSVTLFFLEQTGLLILDHQTVIYSFQGGVLLGITLLSITQTEHLRILREAKERSDATSQAKDEFLTTMSHELRTPMNSVVATANLLKQADLPPREQGYIARLESASRHMLGLIDNILDLSRLEQTGISPNHTTFRLPSLLDNIRQVMEIQAQAKQLALRIHPPANPDVYLQGDPKSLSQVLINLISNSIKFTDQGSVDLYIREAGGTGGDGIRLYFEVADTGIGISPQDQQHLFQPFTQVDNQRTRRYSGSGLGLAISRKLVDAMGGKLELDSMLGEGSRFFFTLAFPIQTNVPAGINLPGDSSGELLTGQAPATATITGKHILLVDDDEMNQFFGRELLNRLGAVTTVAGSGAEAIQQLQQQHFDLVFMDVSMPGMDGYETTRQIRTDPHFAELPIIALTAHAITGERERCLASGMNDYLTKPFTLSDIGAMLQRWIYQTPDSPIRL